LVACGWGLAVEVEIKMKSAEIQEAVRLGRVAVIGSLVDDPGRRPIEGSTPLPCSRCSRAVMLSPATRRRMTDLSVVLCVDCAVAIAEERGELWENPGYNEDQLREMAANGIKP